MVSKGTAALIVAASIASGLLVWIFVGGCFARDIPSEIPITAASPIDSRNLELTHALETLTVTVEGLRLQLANFRVPEPISKEEVLPAFGGDQHPCVAAAGEFSRAVHELHNTLAGFAPRLVTGRNALPRDRSVLRGLHEKEESEVAQEHLLWTSFDVLQEYGKPDSISVTPSGGIRWVYEYEGARTIFNLMDGEVIGVVFD